MSADRSRGQRRSLVRRLRRLSRRAAPFLRVALVLSGLFLLCAALLGWQALQVKDDASEARRALDATHQAATRGDLPAARAALSNADGAARSASHRTDGMLWKLFAHLPGTRGAVREVRGVAHVTHRITSAALPPLVASTPEGGTWRGRADLRSLARTSESLGKADLALAQAEGELRGLPNARIKRVTTSRRELAKALAGLRVDVHEAAVLTRVLPGLLGDGAPGQVLVAAQNNAEERATGGLIGAFAVLRTRDGAFQLGESGANSRLQDAPRPVVELGPEFSARYGRAQAAASWRSSNLTPDVPTAGKILSGLAAKRFGSAPNGVVLVDPVALSYVLRATGPVTTGKGLRLSADNVVDVLLHDVYQRYPTPAATPEREEVFVDALRAVVQRLQRPVASVALVRELREGLRTGHIQVFAREEAAEKDLKLVAAGGALPTKGPFLSLVTQDAGGSKLGYYLRRSVTYDAKPTGLAVDLGAGPENVDEAVVTVRLTNNAPARGLPPYVTLRPDLTGRGKAPLGQLKTWVSVYLGPRASYSAARLDGRPVALSSQTDAGLAVFSTFVTIDPGKTVELVMKVNQPMPEGAFLVWRQQPRLQPDTLVLRRSGAPMAFGRFYAEG